MANTTHVDTISLDELDTSKEAITYCAGPQCDASRRAAEQLAQRGFRVRAFEGGLEAWKQADLRDFGSQRRTLILRRRHEQDGHEEEPAQQGRQQVDAEPPSASRKDKSEAATVTQTATANAKAKSNARRACGAPRILRRLRAGGRRRIQLSPRGDSWS